MLLKNFPDYKFLQPDRMFSAMFALMFGVFAFVQAQNTVIDKDKGIESARKMFELIQTPSAIDVLAPE